MEYNFDNERPIYLQLAETLKKEIITGKYSNGEKLPSVRELAIELKVNPNTIGKAFNELESEGIIYTKRTSGKFVTEDNLKLKSTKSQIIEEKINKLITEIKELGIPIEDVIDILKKEEKNENNS